MGSSNAKRLIRGTLCLCWLLGVVVGIVNASAIQMPTYNGEDDEPQVDEQDWNLPPSAGAFNVMKTDVEPKPEGDEVVRNPPAGPGVFNVMKYGAVGDGNKNDVKAFMAAWQAACAHKKAAEFVVPKGTFMLGEVIFSGPCAKNASPKVVINGDLKALPRSLDFPESEWITFRELNGLVIVGGGTIDGQGEKEAWSTKTTCGKKKKKHCRFMPTSLKIISCTETRVDGLCLVNSKGYHVRINRCTDMRVSNLNITAPDDSPNTDGVHVSRSTDVLVTKSIIGVGDDCVSLGNGNNNITISEIQCGPGHGISVGSLGKYKDEASVNGIHVKNCTLTGTDNGVRIKTWPNSPSLTAAHMTFENIVMDSVSFPIIIDQNYCPTKGCPDTPSNVKISDVTFKNIKGTSFTKLAVNLICSAKYPCKNIQMEDINLTHQDTQQKTAAMCLNTQPTVSGTMDPPPCD